MKIKYLYNSYYLLDTYPTDEDIHYQIVKYQTENNKIGEEFSDKGAKSILEYKVEQDVLVERLNSLVEFGYLATTRTSKEKTYYTLIKETY